MNMFHRWLIRLIFFLKLIVSHSLSVGFNSVPPNVTRACLIDAGSGGSRLHVFRWAPRVFHSIPIPISFPTQDEKWTARMSPGIATLASSTELIAKQLSPLIDFAKNVLVGFEDQFKYFPIYFKATGGMRELSPIDREMVMTQIRFLLSDKSFCPFYFRPEFARVISGEEEAVYSWAAANFLLGSLLPLSQGTGTVTHPVNVTYGTLDLGGSSTQIAFYSPNEDVMEGLFKLQIGGQKHWNVYAKSFLMFGINSARKRYFSLLSDDLHRQNLEKDEGKGRKDTDSQSRNWTMSPCLHSGYSEQVRSGEWSPFASLPPIALKGPSSSSFSRTSSSTSTTSQSQFQACLSSLRPILFLENDAPIKPKTPFPTPSSELSLNKELSTPLKEPIDSATLLSGQSPVPTSNPRSNSQSLSYCQLVYHGDCSLSGAYQPKLPQGQHGHFIGTSSFRSLWLFLSLPDTCPLSSLKEKAQWICSLDYPSLLTYNQKLAQQGGSGGDGSGSSSGSNAAADPSSLPYYCFLSTYVLMLLTEGYGFNESHLVTVVDQVRGNKLGWALGALLYEINTLPWALEPPPPPSPWPALLSAACLGLVLGGAGSFAVLYELYSERRREGHEDRLREEETEEEEGNQGWEEGWGEEMDGGSGRTSTSSSGQSSRRKNGRGSLQRKEDWKSGIWNQRNEIGTEDEDIEDEDGDSERQTARTGRRTRSLSASSRSGSESELNNRTSEVGGNSRSKTRLPFSSPSAANSWAKRIEQFSPFRSNMVTKHFNQPQYQEIVSMDSSNHIDPDSVHFTKGTQSSNRYQY